MKIKNLKYYMTVLGLTAALSLTSCGSKQNVLLTENNTQKEITDKENLNQEKAINLKTEEKTLNNRIFNITDLYVNISKDMHVNINVYADESAIKIIPLTDLYNYYGYVDSFTYKDGYSLGYNVDDNTISEEQIKNVEKNLYYQITDRYPSYYDKYIPIEDIYSYDPYKISNGKLYCQLDLIASDNSNVDNSESCKSFKERYNLLIKEVPYLQSDGSTITKECISCLDYALLDYSIAYSVNLEDIFEKLPNITDTDVENYKNDVLTRYNLYLFDEQVRFDPNLEVNIQQAFINFITKNKEANTKLYERNFKDLILEEIDYTNIAMFYIAINKDNITDETIDYLKGKYILDENIKATEIPQLKLNALKLYNDYGYDLYYQEELASTNASYHVLKKLSEYKLNNNFPHEEFNLNENYEDLCYKLLLLQKTSNSINNVGEEYADVITQAENLFMNNYITIEDLLIKNSELEKIIFNSEYPYHFSEDKDYDLKIMTYLLGYYYGNRINYGYDEIALNNFDIANKRKEEIEYTLN